MSDAEQDGRPQARFLNPYNFVSLPDRDALPEALRDGPPAGHDRYDPDRWTGSIPLTLTTLTPLLLPDHAQAVAGGKGDAPPPLPVRVDQDGRPMLSMSAVKGVLRSRYEAITNSRLGVFIGHDTQLAIRGMADTTRLAPAVVMSRDEEANTAEIRWVKSLTPRHDMRRPGAKTANSIRPQPAVWVPANEAKKYQDGELLEAWLCLAQHQRGFWVWRAFGIGLPDSISTTAPNFTPSRPWLGKLTVSDHPFIRVVGRLHRTDSTFPAGGRRKHDERLVVEQLRTPDDAHLDLRTEVIGAPLIAGWQAVIDSFAQAHEGEPDLRKKYGSYVHTPRRWRSLPEGRTLHVELDAKGKITALYPAMIGRKPFPGAPAVSLPEPHHPATSRDKLSAADRVFGWVRQGADQDGVAHRGHLRVEAGQRWPAASAVEKLPFPLPLTTLNSPKPAQFLFYLADKDGAPLGGKPKQPGNGYPKNPDERRLRGRKVYLTHRDVLTGAPASREYWKLPADLATARRPLTGDGPRYREYIAPDGAKDKVTTTVTQWVRPGTEFTVLLRVDNLSRTELAALLWLLDLPDGAALQFGLGAPLGFGAVRVAADWDHVHLCTGDQIRARYRSLSSVPEPEPVPAVRSLVDEYDKLLGEHLAQVRIEFLAAATGFPGLPVHYPRASPAPEAESYKWWVANDASGKQPGKRLALPPLVTDDGHPQPPQLPYQAPLPPKPYQAPPPKRRSGR